MEQHGVNRGQTTINNYKMLYVTSFAPIAGEMPRILILGSMPGLASLNANQYYAHPQNAFWKIIATITGCPAEADYVARTAALQRAGIALWDVLESCIRRGSLDADIDMKSAKANNIADFLLENPRIKTICFNGATAETIFKRRILPTLHHADLRYIRLPSSSPAHAGMPLQDKIAAWQATIRFYRQSDKQSVIPAQAGI